MDFDLRLTLDFLRELRENNTKSWFDAHRDEYEAARGAFTTFVTTLLENVAAIEDFGTVRAADCIFRLNRDVRFAADKSPYKTSMGAVLAKGGRKPIGHAYYVHIQPDDESFVAGGFWAPTPQQLDRVRHSIDRNATALRAVLRDPQFIRYFGAMKGEQVKSAPQGYPKDHPAIDLLRYKQLMATHSLTDAVVQSEGIVAETLAVCNALKPFVTCVHEYAA
jgi:uncharacterized protein (TIGR02453 family)